jgi:hypothetical protein
MLPLLSLLPILLVPLLPQPAKADLDGADITGPKGQTTTGQAYEARCGIKKEKCKVSFKDEKLIINDGAGIYRDQFVSVVLTRECTQRAVLMPWVTSCFQNQLDWDFTITYKASDGTQRTALISFMPRYFNTNPTDVARSFERDLQIWSEDVLRPIGPSIQVEPSSKPDARPSRRPAAVVPVTSCKPPLIDYGCSWSKYLAANPSVSGWAKANPQMAEKERIRLGGID